MVSIKVITGSVRPNRFNIQPAEWIYDLLKSRSEAQAELLDLEILNLPFMDEPNPPIQHKYTQEHTLNWSHTIESSDGFIFVTPEYNHSISPALKNAVDYLWSEWNYKPVCFVSYGSQAGGARAVEQWREIAAELKMYDLREQILLPNYWERLDSNGKYQFSVKDLDDANKMLDMLIFWANKMKDARTDLLSK